MKRILFVCLFLIATVITYAQTASKECLYHIKFYNWQWDYFRIIGYDTIAKYDMATGEAIGDTIVWDTAVEAISHTDLKLPVPFPSSFVDSTQQITVTSFDGLKKYVIKSFKISCVGDAVWATHKDGSTCTVEELKKFETFVKSKESITGIYLTIDLEGTSDEIVTSNAEIVPVRQ